MKFPIVSKCLALGAVLLGLLMALSEVSGVVRERQGRLLEVQRGIADSLAGAQTIAGPVLQRECTERWRTEEGQGKDRKWVDHQTNYVLATVPQRLKVESSAKVEPRSRGIFSINSYTLQATLRAEWSELKALQPEPARAGVQQQCTLPSLWVEVSDMRGARRVQVQWMTAGDAGPPIEGAVEPGTPKPRGGGGFQVAWPKGQAFDPAAAAGAVISLDLVGTESLAIAPIGEQTHIAMTSDWPHPSFNGRFLPAQRSVSDQGFRAEWQLSALAARSGRDLLNDQRLCHAAPPPEVYNEVNFPAAAGPAAGGATCVETLGVAFVDPVSTYVLSDRATKYGLLFIVLTFLAVGLVEVMRRLRVHPVQYALVGAALALFFLLLVSLSEHISFGAAYATAASACTLLLGYYGAHILQGWRPGSVFAVGVGLVYGMLYLLLRSESTALLLGSVLLFAALAGVMVITRRTDWYALVSRVRSDATARVPGAQTGGGPTVAAPQTAQAAADRAT